MQARYQVKIYSPITGDLQAIFVPDTMYIERKLNSFDELTLTVWDTDNVIQYFVKDAIIEVWRRIDRAGAEYYMEAIFFHRSKRRQFTENQRRIFTCYGRGLNDLLRRRKILYYAGTAYTLKAGPGETVMKAFVDENLGPGADNDDRLDDWDASALGLTVQTDGGLGAEWSGARSWQNLLDVLNEISLVASVDFEIVRVGHQGREFEFRTHYPQLGQDRTSEPIFSIYNANMTAVDFTVSATEEANAVAVLGQGEESSRTVLTDSDADAIAESPWNVCEVTADARSQPTVAELQSVADQTLQELAQQTSFNFLALQTDARQYGQDAEYWFGDLVRAEYDGVVFDKKIVGVTINVAAGREDINFTFADIPTVE